MANGDDQLAMSQLGNLSPNPLTPGPGPTGLIPPTAPSMTGPGMTSGATPPMLPPVQGKPAPFQEGANTAMLPTGSATNLFRGIRPQTGSVPPLARQGRGWSGGSGILGMVTGIMQMRQNAQQSKMEKDAARVGGYLASANSTDPALQKQAQTMLGDKEMQKIYDKAMKDPMSPEGQAIQLAYQQRMQADAQKQATEMQRRQMDYMEAYKMAAAQATLERGAAARTQAGAAQERADTGRMGEIDRNQQAYAKMRNNLQGIQMKVQAQAKLQESLEGGRNWRAQLSANTRMWTAMLSQKGQDRRTAARIKSNLATAKAFLALDAQGSKEVENGMKNIDELEKDMDNHGWEGFFLGKDTEWNAKMQAFQAQVDAGLAKQNQAYQGMRGPNGLLNQQNLPPGVTVPTERPTKPPGVTIPTVGSWGRGGAGGVPSPSGVPQGVAAGAADLTGTPPNQTKKKPTPAPMTTP